MATAAAAAWEDRAGRRAPQLTRAPLRLAHAPARAPADALRDEGGFRREYDGHVWVQARSGGWMEVRLDAKVPGTVLLRDEATGAVYFISNSNVQQVRGGGGGLPLDALRCGRLGRLLHDAAGVWGRGMHLRAHQVPLLPTGQRGRCRKPLLQLLRTASLHITHSQWQ